MSLLIAVGLALCRAVEDWVIEAGDRCGALRGFEVEDHDLIFALLEPGCGYVEGLLRAYVPEAADGVAVYPECAFAEFCDVKEGVAGLGEGETRTSKHRWFRQSYGSGGAFSAEMP